MATTAVQCPKCKATLLNGVFNLPDFSPCPVCAAALQMEVYPALFRRLEAGSAAVAVMAEGEASCYYHPQKKAVLPCEGCGRFVCALCDCEHQGQHLCPACLEVGRTKGKIKSLENARTRYDNIAIALALYPILIFYFTVITAPMTLFVVFRYWKAPRGLTQPSSARFVVAMVVALLQLGGWTLLIISLVTR